MLVAHFLGQGGYSQQKAPPHLNFSFDVCRENSAALCAQGPPDWDSPKYFRQKSRAATLVK
jgi:hypothetical protein